jgi:serine/threonine-protein kinase
LLAEYAHPVSNTISEATIINNVVRSVGLDSGTPSAPKSQPSSSSPSAPSFPSSTLAPSDWSIPVLSGIEVELARFIGPVAKVLVRRAARKHKDINALVVGLLDALDRTEDREAFARAVIGRGVELPPDSIAIAVGSATAGTSAPPPPAGPPVTPAEVERAVKLLTSYIGPIAKVVAKRAAVGGVTKQVFLNEVARSLESEAQRERFLRDATVAGG